MLPSSVPLGREGSVVLAGARHAFVTWGADTAPAVLCLHGWLDNAYSFAPLAAHLPGKRLIALELAGQGHSDHRPASVAYHYLDWVRDVWAVADALGLHELSLVGHSLGAGIAALATGVFPERVRHLVLIEGTGPRSAHPEDLPPSLASYLTQEAQAQHAPRPGRPAAFEVAVRARLVSSPLARRSAELLAQRGTKRVGDGVVWRNDRRLMRLHPSSLDESQVRAFLQRIACPTLFIHAREGIDYDRELVNARLGCVANLHEVELPGQHHLHMDDPAPTAQELRAFLDQRRESATSTT